MYECEPTRAIALSTDPDKLTAALRKLPTPEPRPGFVDRALAHAIARKREGSSRLRSALTRWETWFAASVGGAIAAAVTFAVLRWSSPHPAEELGIALSLNETRQIDVMIESSRPLHNATIRIAVSGGIELDGFDNEHQIDWQADLERGSNLLSLPVVGREAGRGRLVAVVEHEGKIQTVAVDLRVKGLKRARS